MTEVRQQMAEGTQQMAEVTQQMSEGKHQMAQEMAEEIAREMSLMHERGVSWNENEDEFLNEVRPVFFFLV